jgi:hypothetical protein
MVGLALSGEPLFMDSISKNMPFVNRISEFIVMPQLRLFLSPFGKGGQRGILKLCSENLPFPLFSKEGY